MKITELLDLLAEKFLQQGRSISYTKIAENPALKVTSENREMLFLPVISSEVKWQELPKDQEIYIPVLKDEEETWVLGLIRETGRKDIKVYRLNLHERYLFYGVGF